MIDIKVHAPNAFPSGSSLLVRAVYRGMKLAVSDSVRQAQLNASGRPGPYVRTDRLRSSIAGEVQAVGPVVKARIGSNVVYAARVEFGYKTKSDIEKEKVSGTFRTITRGSGGKRLRKDQRWKTGVKPFERTVNSPAYPYLLPAVRSPFRWRAIQIRLETAIKEAANGAHAG